MADRASTPPAPSAAIVGPGGPSVPSTDEGATPDLGAPAITRTLDASSDGLAHAPTMDSGRPGSGFGTDRSGANHRRDGAAALPRMLGRYHILEHLGAGGMGVVYAAYDPDLDRKVAVKLLRYDRGARAHQARLRREAQALARLSHPNVVQIHDVNFDGDQLFLAMEFVRGTDLRTWLSGQERSYAEILRAFLDAGRGLQAAHAGGLVHRDFKPDNVMIGDDGRVRVADFGLVRAGRDEGGEPDTDDPSSPTQPGHLDLSLTATGAVIGTPAYMSPEQHMGLPADARSDQFSFCLGLWEALYRQRPFAGGSLAELALAVQSGRVRPPPPDTRVPRRIAEILRRGLMPDPAQRYPDMGALLAALEHDPTRARRRWLALAVLFAMSTGTAFVLAGRRADEALACSGAAGLATAWGPARRGAVAAALDATGPSLTTRVLAGLDSYAAQWAAAHRDVCLAHRRGELPAAHFDARVRCLERRRLALGSAVTSLAAADPARDPIQLVARLPALATCGDFESSLSEAAAPADPVLARAVAELDVRLIDARTRHHAGDLAGARSAAEAVIAQARRLDFRPLLAEALLLLGRVEESARDFKAAGQAVAEAAVLALATRRDDLAAEALARRIFFDGQNAGFERAFADAPIARAIAERLPAPEAALARLENNLGTLLAMQRDIDGARPYFARATAALGRVADAEPIELSFYWKNLALATRDPLAREQAFARAAELLEGQLGDRHRLALDLRMDHGLRATDAEAGAAILGGLCPRYPELYPDASQACGYCFYNLGHLHAAVGERERALHAFARVELCIERGARDRDHADRFAALRDRTAAFAALLRDHPTAALAHADAALVRSEPYKAMWWVAGEMAELDLARARALLALERRDEARAALARALPVFEDMTRARVQVLESLWLDETRNLLAGAAAAP